MIRKDVNDALNNLKKESSKNSEQKHIKSKFDDMSPDELLYAINNSKKSNSAPATRKLKRIPPNTQQKVPDSQISNKKKRIVIGELPDYDALIKQEKEASEIVDEKTETLSVVEDSTAEKHEENGNFTVEEINENPIKESEMLTEISDEESQKVNTKEDSSENDKNAEVPEPKEIIENRPKNKSNSKKKKKKKKNSANKPQNDLVVPEIKAEDSESKENQEKINKDDEPKNIDSENVEEIKTSENTEQINVDNIEMSETKEKVESDNPNNSGKEKRNVLSLAFLIIAIIGIIALIKTFVFGGGVSSSKEKFAKVVYPAVIMDINSFDSPSELPNNQILSATIWSIIIDDKKLSNYNERMGIVNIPAVDVEKFAVELFGEDIPELTHTTVGSAESKFYYNSEAQSYSVQVEPDMFTYSPEVVSVSKENNSYIVQVEYVEEHPEWMDKSVSKLVEFSLSENNSSGYTIDSMKIISEN